MKDSKKKDFQYSAALAPAVKRKRRFMALSPEQTHSDQEFSAIVAQVPEHNSSPKVFNRTFVQSVEQPDALFGRISLKTSQNFLEDSKSINSPLRSRIDFSPKNAKPEIEQLLNSSRHDTCLPGKTTNLGQFAFKVLKDTNLMSYQSAMGEDKLRQEFRLKKEALDRRMLEAKICHEDYLRDIKIKREMKRCQQNANSEFWQQQMAVKKLRKQRERQSDLYAAQHDPQWNIEAPDRWQEFMAQKRQKQQKVAQMLSEQQALKKQRKQD